MRDECRRVAVFFLLQPTKSPTKAPTQAPTPSKNGGGEKCEDYVPSKQAKWFDSDGSFYDCDWYASHASVCGTLELSSKKMEEKDILINIIKYLR